jgi:hypothetical protein
MATLSHPIVFRKTGGGLARKLGSLPYTRNRCAVCQARLANDIDWLCNRCRSGDDLAKAIEAYRQVSP